MECNKHLHKVDSTSMHNVGYSKSTFMLENKQSFMLGDNIFINKKYTQKVKLKKT
jgi:hypothetical protein